MKNKLELFALKKAKENLKLKKSEQNNTSKHLSNEEILKTVVQNSEFPKGISPIKEVEPLPTKPIINVVPPVSNRKKYVSHGRRLASTQVVDLRAYTRGKNNLFDDDNNEDKKDENDDEPSQDDSDDLSDKERSTLLSKLFGEADDDSDEELEQDKPISKPMLTKTKDLTIKRPKPQKRVAKPSRKKKKKLDIDIISGGNGGDII